MHYVVIRTEHGWNSGPGTGVAFPDETQVMTACRTLPAARRAVRRLGGRIAQINAPFAEYAQNEELSSPIAAIITR
jgi:hypothetical protein